jgi:hypothetical protein
LGVDWDVSDGVRPGSVVTPICLTSIARVWAEWVDAADDPIGPAEPQEDAAQVKPPIIAMRRIIRRDRAMDGLVPGEMRERMPIRNLLILSAIIRISRGNYTLRRMRGECAGDRGMPAGEIMIGRPRYKMEKMRT